MKNISLLGSTGSIGVNTLTIVRDFPDRFTVRGLAAGRNIELLSEQILEFCPEIISVADEQCAEALTALVPSHYHDRIVYGVEGNTAVATLDSVDTVVSAIVGAAGLLPTLAAIDSGKKICLANKETLVMAGKIVMAAVEKNGVELLPVDSEHSAIFQVLEAGRRKDVRKIVITASGGPFLAKSKEALEYVSVEQALEHPNWSMGRKISIDSATMMNKGLEVIEAKWLFNLSPKEIDVVVHPQSVVHSMVEFQDGSVIAQLGIPDMQIPIAYALTYPERIALNLEPLSLTSLSGLEFRAPDTHRFPALDLAFKALNQGGVSPAVLNAANEVAVAAFLDKKIGFMDIPATVARVMDEVCEGAETNLEDIIEADRQARRYAEAIIRGL